MAQTLSTSTATGDGKGLKTGAIGLVGSVVVGVASTAPAYSLAATLGLVVVGGTSAVGVKAPAVMLLAFIPMYFIAQAYKELNEADPDCGTTFTWSSRAFGAVAGWMGGWGIIISDLIVMSNLAQIAGTYTFSFIGSFGVPGAADLGGNVFWSTTVGVLWIVLMTYICYRGIEVSARLQYALLGFEILMLVVFAGTAIVRVAAGHGEPYSVGFSIDWLNPAGVPFFSGLLPAILAAVFIYWGWDSAVSVNEETRDPGRTPGRAAILSTVLLLLTYVLVSIATVSFAGVGDKGIGLANTANQGDVFSAMASAVFGNSAFGHVLQILFAATILTSASSSTQTTILPTARTALSMAVHKALPSHFGRMHPRFSTPTWSTVGMGVVSIVLYVGFTLISPSLLTALIYSIGLMIAFYYGLTGIACVWFYRRTIFTSARHFVFRGLFPFLGFAILAALFVAGLMAYSRPDYVTDANGKNVTILGIGATAVVGVIGLLVGFVLMAVWWWRNPEYFRGGVIQREAFHEGTPVLDAYRVNEPGIDPDNPIVAVRRE